MFILKFPNFCFESAEMEIKLRIVHTVRLTLSCCYLIKNNGNKIFIHYHSNDISLRKSFAEITPMPQR